MIFDIPQDLIDDLLRCPEDESNHLHVGYWILDYLKQKDDISYSKGNSVNFPSDKETI